SDIWFLTANTISLLGGFFNAAANQLPAGTTLVIDEFPYLGQNAPELPSAMQKLLDGRRLRFHLAICGSSLYPGWVAGVGCWCRPRRTSASAVWLLIYP
ncbi:hypothetical protein ACHHRT_12865, partial [Desulfurivibrio sp. D14AmB]